MGELHYVAPPHIQMILLSATIDNPKGFAEWCEKGRFADNKEDDVTPTNLLAEKKCIWQLPTNVWFHYLIMVS